MNEPKRHHFVPQSYLQNFTDSEGYLHLFDKRNGKWLRQKPEKCMHRKKYYRQEVGDSGIDPNILETTLANVVESSAKIALDKLATWSQDLTVREWSDIVIYLAFQRIRVPRQINATKELVKSFILMYGDPDETAKVLQGKWSLEVLDGVKFDYMKMTLEHFHPIFMRMKWEIIKPQHSEFLTTDSPVTFFNPKVFPPFEPGLNQIGTVVLFPFRKDRLLLMHYPEFREGANPLDEVRPIEGKPQTIVNFRLEWPKSQVDQHNSLMIESSDRLSAGSSKMIIEDALRHKISSN